MAPRTLWGGRITSDETGEHTVLVETGAGDQLDEHARRRMRLPPESRPLAETIAAHGIDPERIEVVLNSHLALGSLRRQHRRRVPRAPARRLLRPAGRVGTRLQAPSA